MLASNLERPADEEINPKRPFSRVVAEIERKAF